MKFWWVNHNQSYELEHRGGYIWSPKQTKSGSKIKTYTNLTIVKKNDVIFSYARGFIRAIGIVVEPAADKDRPLESSQLLNEVSKNGWLLEVNWIILESSISPKNNIKKIAPLLPTSHSPIQQNGNGNEGYLYDINSDLGNLLLELSGIKELIQDQIEISQIDEEADIIEEDIKKQVIPETEKIQLIMSRRGQGVFRNSVLDLQKQCRVTGIEDKRFLIASHIKPWIKSSNEERLDGNNGLLLSPHIDKLFDYGWISFSDAGKILIANNSIEEIMISWGININKNVGLFNNKQNTYLEFHRENIFKGSLVHI